MIYAQILAGGKGSRMGNVSMPKQFLMLGNKPIIIHTLEKFILNDEFKKIIVTCPEKWIEHTNDLVNKFLKDDRVVIIAGGKERNDTLMNGIEYIEKNFGINEKDCVVTHDAVRPFVTKRIIDDNIELVQKFPAVDTVISAVDTIVQGSNGKVDSIPIRDLMYQGQTPQSFNIVKLKKSFDMLNDEDKAILSDSCKICLLAGEEVAMVEGENFNIKITTPYDLKIANALIEVRE